VKAFISCKLQTKIVTLLLCPFCYTIKKLYIWWYEKCKNSSVMEKITLSLRNALLKKQIKTYAQKKGLTVSGIVENYLQNLIKLERQKAETDYNLPGELDSLLEGLDISDELQKKDYKTLRDEMYASRAK